MTAMVYNFFLNDQSTVTLNNCVQLGNLHCTKAKKERQTASKMWRVLGETIADTNGMNVSPC